MAIYRREQPAFVLMGKQAIDDDSNQVGQMLAALLGMGQATFVSKLELIENNTKARCSRETDSGIETVTVKLPAIITSDLRLNEPRYVSLPGIMKAKKKPLEEVGLADLGLTVASRTQVLKLEPPACSQSRRAGQDGGRVAGQTEERRKGALKCLSAVLARPNSPNSIRETNMANLLVIAEHDRGQLKLATLAAVACAHKVVAEAGGSFDILVIGENVGGTAELLRPYGAATVLVADDAQLQHPVGDKYAQVIADVAKQRGRRWCFGAASTFSKDILPRAAALLDAGMLSDVIDVHMSRGDFIFKRVMFAGNVIATVKLDGAVKFLTVRAAAFAQPPKGSGGSRRSWPSRLRRADCRPSSNTAGEKPR